MSSSARSRRERPLRTMLRDYWREVATMAAVVELDALEAVAATLIDCQARGRTVFTAGNGGSASTASHFACDLAKGTRAGGPPTFRVVALTDNLSMLTAWANDCGYDRVFAEQLASLAQPGDVLVAISASGNSPNVLAAAAEARARGMTTVALTGRHGGRLARLADQTVRIPSNQIEIVEDAHLVIAHSLCVAARQTLAAMPAPNGHARTELVPVQLAGG